MRLDVYFTADELADSDRKGRVVAVIDVLRASTTIAVALANGARAVIPFEDTDELLTRAKQFERDAVVLAGERRMLPIEGFDVGNSPAQFPPEVVSGKTVLLTTTNGTRALLSTQGASDVVVASYVNVAPITAMLRAALRSNADVVIACAGQDGHYALEDAVCAGCYVRALSDMDAVLVNDAAQSCGQLALGYGDDIMNAFMHAAHGRALADAGFDADLAICSSVNSNPVIPVFAERQITKLGPDRER